MTISSDLGARQNALSANESIRDVIFERFEQSPYHELRHLDVVVSTDQIALSGIVPTFFIKQVAQETAKQACSHRQIQNLIRVSA